MKMSIQMAAGLLFAAYCSMGDGGCSTVQSDNRTFSFYGKDVCGSKAPFYWKADKVGRKVQIDMNTNENWTEIFDGEYKEPILLPCPANPDSYYLVVEIH